MPEGLPRLLPMTGRSPGVHVSTVITDLAIRLGYLSGKAELSTTWAELGCALERSIIWAYEREFPGRYLQPGEQCRDDIYCTPDLADWSPSSPHPNGAPLTDDECELLSPWPIVPEEIKCSWMTSRHTPRDCDSCGLPTCKKFWRYERQLQCECAMPYYLGATVGKLTVVHVNGSGRGGEGPAHKPWLFAYTVDEIESNWQVVVNHAHTLRCGECGGRGVSLSSLSLQQHPCRACNGTGVKLSTEGV